MRTSSIDKLLAPTFRERLATAAAHLGERATQACYSVTAAVKADHRTLEVVADQPEPSFQHIRLIPIEKEGAAVRHLRSVPDLVTVPPETVPEPRNELPSGTPGLINSFSDF